MEWVIIGFIALMGLFTFGADSSDREIQVRVVEIEEGVADGSVQGQVLQAKEE